MARLIDANELTRWLEMVLANENPLDRKARSAFSVVLARVKTMPDIEAVPVVRCRDCARSRPLRGKEIGIFESYCLICNNPHGCGVRYPEYDIDDRVVLPTSYCSYGHTRHSNTVCPNCGAKLDGGAEG